MPISSGPQTLRRAAAVAGVVLLAIVGATTAVGDPEPPPESPAEGIEQVTTVEEQAANALSTLDTAPSLEDAIPEELAGRLDENARFGMNPDLSRQAIDTLSDTLYLVPANDHVCTTFIVGEEAWVNCAQTDDLSNGTAGASTVALPGGGIAIFGMVPDGIGSVTVTTGTSTTATVDTANNAYYTVVPAGTALRHVAYTGPDGPAEFPIYDPSSAFGD